MENKNESLYRFTLFESLVDIIQTKELTLISPSLWDDPYESYAFSSMKTDEGIEKIESILKKYLNSENVAPSLMILKSSAVDIFGQCWTKKSESDALWRIYSHENMSVRIEIPRSDILKLSKVYDYDVEYVEEMNLENEIKKIFIDRGNSFSLNKAVCTKRKAFNHEEEVRLLSNIYNNNFLLQKNKRISFSHIEGFIKSILLNPLAPSWFESTLSKYCDLNGINYLGKSKLYDLQVTGNVN